MYIQATNRPYEKVLETQTIKKPEISCNVDRAPLTPTCSKPSKHANTWKRTINELHLRLETINLLAAGNNENFKPRALFYS